MEFGNGWTVPEFLVSFDIFWIKETLRSDYYFYFFLNSESNLSVNVKDTVVGGLKKVLGFDLNWLALIILLVTKSKQSLIEWDFPIYSEIIHRVYNMIVID